MFAIIIFTLYVIALICTKKLDINLPSVHSWGHSIDEYITSKNPQSTADVEYWMNQYTRKNSF